MKGILAGDLIAVEKSICSLLHPDQQKSFLKHCLYLLQGRHAVAMKGILAGDLIAVEKSICSLLHPDQQESLLNHCQHCYTFTKAPLPCEVIK
jgi:hypothetical protein